jgi:hypothetical protein
VFWKLFQQPARDANLPELPAIKKLSTCCREGFVNDAPFQEIYYFFYYNGVSGGGL